jgi:FkbM family methyltransferase
VWNAPKSRTDTHFLYREIFQRQCYQKNGVAVNNGDVVFDIGANVGMFSLWLMERFKDLRIYCCEPVPGTYTCLARNLAEAPQRKEHEVTALNVGAGREEGTATIEFFPGVPSNSTLHSADKHRDFSKVLDGVRWRDLWASKKLRALVVAPLFPLRKQLLGPAFARALSEGVTVSCQVRMLSGIIREHGVERIDLLKIDVEGAEMDVLAGIEEEHWPRIRQLCMEVEISNKQEVPALTSRLRRLGFNHVTVENMFGGADAPDDRLPCTLFAVRSR